MLRTMLGPEMKDVTGEWRRLHNEKLNDQYYHQIIFGEE